MDPDEALRQIRLLVQQVRAEDPVPAITAGPEFVQHARDLVEQFEALDRWISNGGFIPLDWKAGQA